MRILPVRWHHKPRWLLRDLQYRIGGYRSSGPPLGDLLALPSQAPAHGQKR